MRTIPALLRLALPLTLVPAVALIRVENDAVTFTCKDIAGTGKSATEP